MKLFVIYKGLRKLTEDAPIKPLWNIGKARQTILGVLRNPIDKAVKPFSLHSFWVSCVIGGENRV